MYLQYSLLPYLSLFAKCLKVPYTISVSMFVDNPYWPPYSTDKLISCVLSHTSQWFFHFGEEIIIAWTYGVSTVDVPESPIASGARGQWLQQRCESFHYYGGCWGSLPPTASRSPWKHSCVLWPRTTSILIQEHCSCFVNIVLGPTHYPYKVQRSIHCSRLTEYCRCSLQ